MNKLYQTWKRRTFFEKVLIIVAVWYVYNFLSTYIKGVQKAAAGAADSINNSTTANNYAIDVARLDILRGYAVELEIAIHNWKSWWPFGYMETWAEDEQTVIDRINACKTAAEVKFLSDYYYTDAYPSGLDAAKKTTLKADVEKYLSSSEQNQIKAIYRAALR